MTSESELLPCPFCGSGEASANEAFGDWWVGCPCNHSSGFHLTEEAARDAWNTRATHPVQGEAVACQACGGRIEGWTCQGCARTFRENDSGVLVMDTAPPPVGEGVRGWLREDSDMCTLIYTLREDGFHQGKPRMVNDQTVRIEGPDMDARRALAAAIIAALTPPAGGEG